MIQATEYSIGELCEMEKGSSPTMKTPAGDYPLVVTAEFRRTSDTYQFDTEAVCVPLVSSTGHGNAALHRVHYQGGKFALANLLVALIPRDPQICNAKYLYYLFQDKKDYMLVPLMQGTANVSLKVQDIANVIISLPPHHEQRRVVDKIEALAAKIDEARWLREEIKSDMDALLVSMAHRNDLSNKEKLSQGWKHISFGEVLTQVSDPVEVEPGEEYPHFGIYSFARGLFKKAPLLGDEIKASKLYRVQEGQFIYSRLKAFEGAFGSVSTEFNGRHVSNEFPTFLLDQERVNNEFLVAYLKSKMTWKELAVHSKGVGARRERLKPVDFLAHDIWLPPLNWQHKIKVASERLKEIKEDRDSVGRNLEALLPAILDQAFRGEL